MNLDLDHGWWTMAGIAGVGFAWASYVIYNTPDVPLWYYAATAVFGIIALLSAIQAARPRRE